MFTVLLLLNTVLRYFCPMNYNVSATFLVLPTFATSVKQTIRATSKISSTEEKCEYSIVRAIVKFERFIFKLDGIVFDRFHIALTEVEAIRELSNAFDRFHLDFDSLSLVSFSFGSVFSKICLRGSTMGLKCFSNIFLYFTSF